MATSVLSVLPPSSLAVAHHLRNGVDELLGDSVVPRVVLLRLGVGRRVSQPFLKRAVSVKKEVSLINSVFDTVFYQSRSSAPNILKGVCSR